MLLGNMALMQIDRKGNGYSIKITPEAEGAASPWSAAMTESQLKSTMRRFSIFEDHIAQALEALARGQLATIQIP